VYARVGTVQKMSGELKPALNAHVDNVKRLAENEVSEIFSSTGELVGCARVNEAYFEMKSAFCCEFVVMLYWVAASSVLVGCTGCWCVQSLPASFLGTFGGTFWS
jgi:hypothetical protein